MIAQDWPRYLALIVLLAIAAFAYWRGRRDAPSWTNIPLTALAIVSIGPSVCAVIVYLAYKSGLAQPGPRGYQFSSYVTSLPLDFALLNWAFVPLYVVGRIWPRRGAARTAMWFAVVAMALPNILLFALAPTMVSGAFDAGQGIGVVQAMLLISPIQMIPGITQIIIDAPSRYFDLLAALTVMLPFLGLIFWLLGQFAGRHVQAASS